MFSIENKNAAEHYTKKRKMLPVGQCRAPVKFPHNIGLSVSSSSNIQLVVSFIHLLFLVVSLGARQPADRPNNFESRASRRNKFHEECTEKGEEKEKDKLACIVAGTCWNWYASGHCIFYSYTKFEFNVIIKRLEKLGSGHCEHN